ncbi:cyclic nucleotide-gated cation channel alpha-3-like [Haliotis rubra]|uniref:cyclic nucleotide-gated cation channel alpha-3-like n=1 Tax=Haliotis rubra TaxID=36100 RepID=UPI001EE6326B|nr:cyclic nucleotide-gated cation channel alpha-3-like [Haliotis rubra]XP_046577727.1 cyclic nucleotide-gated cation channel alpha-3-like [Haliotis rubra]
MFLTVAVYYNIIVIILRAVFTELRESTYMPYWFAFDYFFDLTYILDSAVKSRLGFLEQGILVTDVKRLTRCYVKSWKLLVDLLSITPLDLFYFLVGFNPLLRLNRILKVWRVNEFYSDSETKTSSPIGFRLFFLIVNIMAVIHWNACIYFAISKSLGFSTDGWVYDDTTEYKKQLTIKYLYSFYWSMLTLTAIGDTPPPEKIESVLYCICDTLIGVLIFATIFGNIGSMINQMNASRTEFQHDVDAVKRYMEIRKVGSDIQDRVVQWFAYTWNNKQSIDDRQALSILPEKLRAEIAIHVHLHTLKRVAIFQDCEPGLLVELVLKLRLQVFSPGDYICKKGDIGKEMYIIKRGKLEVVSEDGKKVFVTLSDGAVFGEVSILNISGNKTGNRRTASVRSVGYSDLFCLSKDDLWDALKEYPEAKKILMERGQQILRKDNLLDEDAARREELRSMSMDNRISLITVEIDKISKDIGTLTGQLCELQKTLTSECKESAHTEVDSSATDNVVKIDPVKTEISQKEEAVISKQSTTKTTRDASAVSVKTSQATVEQTQDKVNIPGTPDKPHNEAD